jgi:hypothetical protein
MRHRSFLVWVRDPRPVVFDRAIRAALGVRTGVRSLKAGRAMLSGTGA